MSTPTITADQIEALKQFDSPTISNAIEHFDVRDPVTGFASRQLQCIMPHISTPMVGFAITAMGDSSTPGDSRVVRIDELVGLVEQSPTPGVLCVQHVGTDRDRSCLLGDMFATLLDKLGCIGFVSDMSIRDRAGVQQRTPNFHVFSTGYVVSHGYACYVDLNTTVSICGLTVQPGDLLHGDANGVVSIPLDLVDKVIARAHDVRKDEAEYFDFLQSDRFNMPEIKIRIQPATHK